MKCLYTNNCDEFLSSDLLSGFKRLGLNSEINTTLFFVEERNKYIDSPDIWFYLEKAEQYGVKAVFFKTNIIDKYVPQIYIYDYTDKSFLLTENSLADIHKKVWTAGEIPIVCIFTSVEIKILDTSHPIIENKDSSFSPKYLVNNLKLTGKAHKLYNDSFARKIKNGTYWDDAIVNFKNSSYDTLINLLRKVVAEFTKQSGLPKEIVQKLIIQCILVKYLEERSDKDGNRVFPEIFFNKYNGAKDFSDILTTGYVFEFFKDLNDNHFNGGIFKWESDVKKTLDNCDFSYLSKVLRGYVDESGQGLIEFEDNFSRLYAFNFIPVELISRLYEEFVIKGEKTDGVAYTPSHLVKLLVNEVMPLAEIPNNLDDFKVLDPACGSAIFLVVAYKRLVQWWRVKNNYQQPSLDKLKELLYSIYGVDIDNNAAQIAIFSLCVALCDELTPKQIWDNLKFDNLDGKTIFSEDFFIWQKRNTLRFDIIMGNPPFIRGGLKEEEKKWSIDEKLSVDIPQNQIALKFLGESLNLLKEHGYSCLIVKSLSLLYSSSNRTISYKKALFENYHVEQIFDFTPLARNKSLWDGGVDVDTAAIFVSKSKPNFTQNLLHAIFRRTKTNKERIYFEIDKYDLHYISRQEAYQNPYIFKINLLGGGRLKQLVGKCLDTMNIGNYLKSNNCIANEGYILGEQEASDKSEAYMYDYMSLPTVAFTEDGIDFKQLYNIDENVKFIKIPDREFFEYPNLVIKENIGEKKIPVYFNKNRNFTFKDKLIGIYSADNDIDSLKTLYDSFQKHNELYRLFIFATSGQILIVKNTAILKEDIMRLPILSDSISVTNIDVNIINDVNIYMQDFMRHGEKSLITKPLNNIRIDIESYGKEFSKTINSLYASGSNLFQLAKIIKLDDEKFIGVLFTYDTKNIESIEIVDFNSDIENGLFEFNISESLATTRIVQYYSPNQVLFVKPNQKRYWLSSIAYRDADSVFIDILSD